MAQQELEQNMKPLIQESDLSHPNMQIREAARARMIAYYNNQSAEQGTLILNERTKGSVADVAAVIMQHAIERYQNIPSTVQETERQRLDAENNQDEQLKLNVLSGKLMEELTSTQHQPEEEQTTLQHVANYVKSTRTYFALKFSSPDSLLSVVKDPSLGGIPMVK